MRRTSPRPTRERAATAAGSLTGEYDAEVDLAPVHADASALRDRDGAVMERAIEFTEVAILAR